IREKRAIALQAGGRPVLQRNRSFFADHALGDRRDALGGKRLRTGHAAGEGDDVRVVDQPGEGANGRRPQVARVARKVLAHQCSSVSATNEARNHAPAAADSALCTTDSMICIGAKKMGIRSKPRWWLPKLSGMLKPETTLAATNPMTIMI